MKRYLNLPPACLLIAAALAKGRDLLLWPTAIELVLNSYVLTFLLVVFELLMGFWLLSQRLWRVSTAFCYFLFIVFANVALFEILSGSSGCSCFGTLKANPWATLILDLVSLSLLAFWQPKEGENLKLGCR